MWVFEHFFFLDIQPENIARKLGPSTVVLRQVLRATNSVKSRNTAYAFLVWCETPPHVA